MENYTWLALSAGAMMFLAGIAAAVYFRKREKRLAKQIQKMLDDAITGRVFDVHLDESKAAAIENSLWRYLCDKEVFEQKLRKEKLQMQAQISDISHQAVIPISNIILYSQLLEECLESKDFQEKADVEEEILAIREQAGTLDFLIESLVKLSRLETGIINVCTKHQSVQPLLDTIKTQFQEKANQKKLHFIIDETSEQAVFDMKWTIEALANIVDNAIKYTDMEGTVTIHVESYNSFVRIDVIDNGIGILETEQASIFNRFYRSDMVSEKPGVGIGLYLAREVMKAQNGYIKLSSNIGKGSRFSLFFSKEEISQN